MLPQITSEQEYQVIMMTNADTVGWIYIVMVATSEFAKLCQTEVIRVQGRYII